MARYGKTIGVVERVLKGADTKGESTYTRNGEAIYKASIDDHNILRFYHYNKLTLKADLNTLKINKFDGYSSSDRDALNTVLDWYSFPDRYIFKILQGSLELGLMKENKWVLLGES